MRESSIELDTDVIEDERHPPRPTTLSAFSNKKILGWVVEDLQILSLKPPYENIHASF